MMNPCPDEFSGATLGILIVLYDNVAGSLAHLVLATQLWVPIYDGNYEPVECMSMVES